MAQNNDAPERKQFDFWLGDWDVSWSDTGKGTNSITKEMNGMVIHEHFSSPADKYKGESWSMYNRVKKVWQQTWVDNGGEYLVLEGGMKDGKMELTMEKKDGAGKPITLSMVFYNISTESFDWEWRSSADKGKTWKSLWKIHYARRHGFKYSSMKTYYVVLLKTGPNRNQDSATAAKIQDEHLKRFYKLTQEGKLSMVGPLLDDGDIKGICIFNVATKEEAEQLAKEDPAVIAGRLTYELHPFMGMPGAALKE